MLHYNRALNELLCVIPRHQSKQIAKECSEELVRLETSLGWRGKNLAGQHWDSPGFFLGQIMELDGIIATAMRDGLF